MCSLAPAATAGHGRPLRDPQAVDTPHRLAVPVARSMSLLCSGYEGCSKAGMSSAGYAAHNGTMYWRMYAGHNCTNYAAYRMVHSGMPNSRPWSGEGNASNWGHAMRSITDGVPAVGAVAWWDKYVRPAGSAGHVAYVEKVISPDEIIISQDSWGGTFSWARVTRSGGSWPSGFVHFNDVALANTARPAVTGTPKVGAVLSASPGTWTPTGSTTTYSYQWLAGGTAITGATGSRLRLRDAQQGKRITVRVTASRPGFPSSTVRSPATGYVQPGVISSNAAPTIGGGVATVDHALTASPGSWTPKPDTLDYQWYADGVLVEGMHDPTYTPGPAQLGQVISVTVTASRSGYDPVTATSAGTAPVQPAFFVVGAAPTLAGTPRLGQTLTLDPGTWSPAEGTVTVTWLRGRTPIEGANATSYELTPADLGARISARVSVTRPGYLTLEQTARPTPRVKTDPVLRLRTDRPGKGRFAVQVALRAPGLDVVEGTVLIAARGQILRELTLHDGRASAVLRGLPAGTTTFKVRYRGTATTTSVETAKTVSIK